MSEQVKTVCATGTVSGTQHLAHQSYFRIPYAKAERFQTPSAIDSWSSEVNGQLKPEQPFQKVAPFVSGSTPESEDCLFLNVVVPIAAKSSIDPAH